MYKIDLFFFSAPLQETIIQALCLPGLLLTRYFSYLWILVCPVEFQVSPYSLPAMSPQNGLLALPNKMFQICKIALHIWYFGQSQMFIFFLCHYDTSKCFLFVFSIKDQKYSQYIYLLSLKCKVDCVVFIFCTTFYNCQLFMLPSIKESIIGPD